MNSNELLLNKKVNYTRGLFALLILIGHCNKISSTEYLPLIPIQKSNFISVCFFFFISGWSLSINHKTKPGYMRFFYKKIIMLIYLATFCEIIRNVLKLAFHQTPVSFGLNLITNWNWYIYELLLLYIVFGAIYNLNLPSVSKAITLSIVTIISLTISWFTLGHEQGNSVWYYSTLCFPFGCLFNNYYSHLSDFYKQKKIISIISLIIISCACCSCLFLHGLYLSDLVMHNILGMCAILLWLIIINYSNERFIYFFKGLSLISSEIYFYQFVVFEILKVAFEKSSLELNYKYIFCAILCTLILATIMHFINKGIIGFFKSFQKN